MKLSIRFVRYSLFCLLACFVTGQVYAIDALDGSVVYTSSSSANHSNGHVTANQFAALGDNDGLMVSFQATINKNQQPRLLRLDNGHPANTLEVYYSNYTLMLRRFVNASAHVDYVLYDSLFSFGNNVERTFNIQFYFTATFLWVETDAADLSADPKKVSPVFFGLGKKEAMQPFLTRLESARIALGGGNNVGFSIPGVYEVYAYKYHDLRTDIGNKFTAGTLRVPAAGREASVFHDTKPPSALDEEGSGFSVYPNPVKSEATLSFNLPEPSKVLITIQSVQGTILYSNTGWYERGNQYVVIRSVKEEGFSPGLYIISLYTPKGRFVQKLLME